MKNLIKIGAVALFSLAVVACNKADPAAEFKQYNDWQTAQMQTQQALNNEVQQALIAFQQAPVKDPKALEPVLQKFSAQMETLTKGLDALKIETPEIKVLKEQAKSVLALSSEVTKESLQMLSAPSAEAQQKVQEKSAQLMQLAAELNKTENALKAKFPNTK